MHEIKNTQIIIILSALALAVFVFGVFYYKILEAVINPAAFIVSLTAILLILILTIIFSHERPAKKTTENKKTENNQIKEEKPILKKRKKSKK